MIGPEWIYGGLFTLLGYLVADRLLARYYTGSWTGTQRDL